MSLTGSKIDYFRQAVEPVILPLLDQAAIDQPVNFPVWLSAKLQVLSTQGSAITTSNGGGGLAKIDARKYLERDVTPVLRPLFMQAVKEEPQPFINWLLSKLAVLISGTSDGSSLIVPAITEAAVKKAPVGQVLLRRRSTRRINLSSADFGVKETIQRSVEDPEGQKHNPSCSCEAFVALARWEFEALDTAQVGTLNAAQVGTLCSQLVSGLPESSRYTLSASEHESLSNMVATATKRGFDLNAVEGAAVLLYYASTGRMFASAVPQETQGVIKTPKHRRVVSAASASAEKHFLAGGQEDTSQVAADGGAREQIDRGTGHGSEHQLHVGDVVQAKIPGEALYYEGVVVELHGDGSADIDFGDEDDDDDDDGGGGGGDAAAEKYTRVPNDHIRRAMAWSTLEVGDHVKARHQGGYQQFEAIVIAVHNDGTYAVQYDDDEVEERVAEEMLVKILSGRMQATRRWHKAKAMLSVVSLFRRTSMASTHPVDVPQAGGAV
jgi:hypothetical protein